VKKYSCLANNCGLTLVEVLVAAVLLAAVLAPMLGMFTTAAQGYSRGGRETVALNLARGRIETYLALSYDGLDDLPEANGPWQPCPDYDAFEYQLAVTEYDPLLEIREVVLRVRPVADPARQVELATLVARWP